jgi:hypothetical protein
MQLTEFAGLVCVPPLLKYHGDAQWRALCDSGHGSGSRGQEEIPAKPVSYNKRPGLARRDRPDEFRWGGRGEWWADQQIIIKISCTESTNSLSETFLRNFDAKIYFKSMSEDLCLLRLGLLLQFITIAIKEFFDFTSKQPRVNDKNRV